MVRQCVLAVARGVRPLQTPWPIPPIYPFEQKKKPPDPDGTGGLEGGNKLGGHFHISTLRRLRYARLRELAKQRGISAYISRIRWINRRSRLTDRQRPVIKHRPDFPSAPGTPRPWSYWRGIFCAGVLRCYLDDANLTLVSARD
jgi:hypothetical protein